MKLVFALLINLALVFSLNAKADTASCIDACGTQSYICRNSCDPAYGAGSAIGCLNDCFNAQHACEASCRSYGSNSFNEQAHQDSPGEECGSSCYSSEKSCESSAVSSNWSCASSCKGSGDCLRSCALSYQSSLSSCQSSLGSCLSGCRS